MKQKSEKSEKKTEKSEKKQKIQKKNRHILKKKNRNKQNTLGDTQSWFPKKALCPGQRPLWSQAQSETKMAELMNQISEKDAEIHFLDPWEW